MKFIKLIYEKIFEELVFEIIYRMNDFVAVLLGDVHIYVLTAFSILILVSIFCLFIYVSLLVYRKLKRYEEKIKPGHLVLAPFTIVITVIIILKNWFIADISRMTFSEKIVFYVVRLIAVMIILSLPGFILMIFDIA